MLAPITHIQPLTAIRRERILPFPGRIVVRKGQKVSATDVVAESVLPQNHILLDIARGLGLSPEKSDSRLQVKAGAQVSEGDLLAGPVGLTQRVIRAPRDGQVVIVGGGQILLAVSGAPFELKAGISGIVTDLISDRGVIIENTGALIQGVWGNGKIDFGLLQGLARSREDVFSSDRLDVSLRGSIILGGVCKDLEVLKAAADLPIRGLILGSMVAALASDATKMPYPIIVIDGWGSRPMNSVAYKLLSTNERREVILNAQPWDRLNGNRPEVIIPLPASGDLPAPQDAAEFNVGQQVRVLRAPCAGKVGKILDLIPGVSALPNGVLALAGEIRLESGETLLVPLANLEVLE
jgi:hypothetical protein